jgi:hypothetical protein
MSYDFEVRINGVIKMANKITDIPAFHFDGKTATIVAELVEEPPALDVPRLNYGEIQSALEAEGPSPEGAAEESEQKRHGGRRKAPSPQEQAADREGATQDAKREEPDA